jgi:hypothetical protein
MRISNLENKNKHRETISISLTTVIVLSIMVSMTITLHDAKATIEACPDNWTFLLDGINPDNLIVEMTLKHRNFQLMISPLQPQNYTQNIY